MLIAIAAVDEQYGIGYEGKMPWYNKEDLKHFRETTMNHKLILGSITYLNLSSKLDGRDIIVASRHHDQFLSTMTFDEIISKYKYSDELIYVAGGAKVYIHLIPHCKKILLSKLNNVYQVDTYFPKDLLDDFELNQVEEFKSFSLYTYHKIE